MWLGSLSKKSPINIIGAGISGLLVGHYLKKAGFEFKIWDIANRSGGKIHSYHTKYGLVETAANAILLDENVQYLLDDLNLVAMPAKKKLNRWIDHKGQWSNQFPIAMRLLFSLVWRGWKKIPQTNTSLDLFFAPLTGLTWSQQYLSAICRGIYARNSNELTLDALFHPDFLDSIKNTRLNYYQFIFKYFKYKKNNKSFGSISFKNGLQELINKLSEKLKDHLQLNVDPDKVPFTNAIICISPSQTALLLSKTYPDLANLFSQIPMTSVQSMTVFTNKEFSKLKNSFGVLLTPECSENIFGILAQSEIFQDRVLQPNIHSYTLICKIIDTQDTLQQFCQYANLKNENIIEYVCHPWPAAIPVYNLQRSNLILSLKEKLPTNLDLIFFGNYISSVGLKNLVSGANALVKKINHE